MWEVPSIAVSFSIIRPWGTIAVSFSVIRPLGTIAVSFSVIRPFGIIAVSFRIIRPLGCSADFKNHNTQRKPSLKPCKFWPLEKNIKYTAVFKFHCKQSSPWKGGRRSSLLVLVFFIPHPSLQTIKVARISNSTVQFKKKSNGWKIPGFDAYSLFPIWQLLSSAFFHWH